MMWEPGYCLGCCCVPIYNPLLIERVGVDADINESTKKGGIPNAYRDYDGS